MEVSHVQTSWHVRLNMMYAVFFIPLLHLVCNNIYLNDLGHREIHSTLVGLTGTTD